MTKRKKKKKKNILNISVFITLVAASQNFTHLNIFSIYMCALSGPPQLGVVLVLISFHFVLLDQTHHRLHSQHIPGVCTKEHT